MLNYFKLTPFEKIKSGYITWTDNFEYQHNKNKIYLQIIPFFRWLFNRPLSYDKKVRKLSNEILNISQLNSEQWYINKQKINY